MMNNTDTNNWLTITNQYTKTTSDDHWDPGFEIDRQLIFSKFGPFSKFFLRPEKFVKRFFHTVHPLPIEEWQSTEQIKLYDDFCTINVTLTLRFQATYEYAINNVEIISTLNNHIKQAYHALINDIVKKELLNLSDGTWVHKGLDKPERKINSAIREMLLYQKVQSQVSCQLNPSFEGFPNTGFGKENVHLNVLKKSYEYKAQQTEEQFRQFQEEEKQKSKHKQLQLDKFNEIAAIDRKKQTLQADNAKKLLLQEERQQLEKLEIEKRMHEDKVTHNSILKDMAITAELEQKDRYQARLRSKEEKEKINILTHQSKLKERELKATISDYEKEQASWQKARNQVHIDDLSLKKQQQELEFNAEVEAKKRYESQRIAMQKESYELGRNTDTYLRREIELLELEKKRLAIQTSIKNFKINHNQEK